MCTGANPARAPDLTVQVAASAMRRTYPSDDRALMGFTVVRIAGTGTYVKEQRASDRRLQQIFKTERNRLGNYFSKHEINPANLENQRLLVIIEYNGLHISDRVQRNCRK